MNCQECHSREATVLYVHIIESDKTSMHLCDRCAAQKENQDYAAASDQGMAVSDQLGQSAGAVQVEQREAECPACGTTYGEIKKVGRLGCPHCYEAFGERVGQLLKQIHGSLEHSGKRQTQKHAEDLEQLRLLLADAVAQEDFEKAAQLRDRIIQLEQDDDRAAV